MQTLRKDILAGMMSLWSDAGLGRESDFNSRPRSWIVILANEVWKMAAIQKIYSSGLR